MKTFEERDRHHRRTQENRFQHGRPIVFFYRQHLLKRGGKRRNGQWATGNVSEQQTAQCATLCRQTTVAVRTHCPLPVAHCAGCRLPPSPTTLHLPSIRRREGGGNAWGSSGARIVLACGGARCRASCAG